MLLLTGEDDWDDDDAPRIVRSEEAEFYITDAEPGWAELRVSVGRYDSEPYHFSLVWDPLEAISRFEKELSAGRASRLRLRGEPGALEVVTSHDKPEGWVRLQVWLINVLNERELHFEAFCPSEALARSLRTKTGFIAKEYAAAAAAARRRGLFGLDGVVSRVWPSQHRLAAEKTWNSVLESMPVEHQKTHALVEARRRLIGRADEAKVAPFLDALAVEMFGPDQVASAPNPSPNQTQQLCPSEPELLQMVVAAVRDGFAATTDGSAKRAEVLRQRALGNANRLIEEHRNNIGWLARRRLRAAARNAADREVKNVLL
jgi:hypothetical protein